MAKIIAGTGVLVDPNSWELTIFVTDLQTEHTLRVYGEGKDTETERERDTHTQTICP